MPCFKGYQATSGVSIMGKILLIIAVLTTGLVWDGFSVLKNEANEEATSVAAVMKGENLIYKQISSSGETRVQSDLFSRLRTRRV